MAFVEAREADKADYQIGARLFGRIWRLAKPYFARKGAWWPRTIAISIILALPILSATHALLTFVVRDMTNALIAKNVTLYWHLFWLFTLVTAVTSAVMIGMQVLEGWLNQNWRRWLTMHLVDQYLAKRTYYDIALVGDLDNPDQRIQENVGPFITAVTAFPRQCLVNIVTIGTGIAILGTVSTIMIPVVIFFGIAQALVTYFVYTPTIRKNFNITLSEADLRYGILHVRDHAEAIAFYSGEATERVHIQSRLDTVIKRSMNLLYYAAFVIQGSTGALNVFWQLIPYLALVPIYFAGHLSYGSIAQAIAASAEILTGLAALVQFVPLIAQSAPQAIRLAQIQERFDLMEAGRRARSYPQLHIMKNSDSIHLEQVTLETPGGEQTLVNDLNLTLRPGEHLIVTGQTGVGKSSLLRAMGGLWTRGQGTLKMPPPGECLFLPQKPYMILADLRSQLLYPNGDPATTDDELHRVLEAVKLPDLAEKYGGLDAVRDWDKVLSLGEQQRIAFGRVLTSRPRYVFVDEATSAVDFATETHLYTLLANSGASFVSVGHRMSIVDYHTHKLTLLPGGSWKFEPMVGNPSEDINCLPA